MDIRVTATILPEFWRGHWALRRRHDGNGRRSCRTVVGVGVGEDGADTAAAEGGPAELAAAAAGAPHPRQRVDLLPPRARTE